MIERLFLSLAALLVAGALRADGPKKPLPRAFAHNDYEHERPLLDALDCGFCSVEADIWLVKGQLLVAHTPVAWNKDRTLEKLYLDPLRARAKANGGKIYNGGGAFYLMIDVKTEAKDTYAALAKVLEGYADVLTVTREGKVEPKAVTVVISGNRDPKSLADQKVRYAALDGRPSDLDGDAPATLVPWVSTGWDALFEWTGTGAMPEGERKALRELVARAHKQGRKVRFWAAPEKVEVWKELLAADVDFLNTDKLKELEAFLRGGEEKK
ncbi:phosphatidylinositol-specific phospholipase C/glycerophosphodiester phosphodiesterase family protein [Frigoriglobus tundricola]|uniref:Altered inheritance of mitochondria protein 6 n=1 Tax=Frigoriglobus tundricola TaxID=2774151 RepID=A0A6M5YH17_9BACT|nr:phosphatidylinositol-specific phospholipase C/glycerophosphodiester phosphodiesterase family protein [Frigoriglobus tundricola]QJW93349.1 putative secreted protein [Frigoriglobus tundricola]